jgi:Ulp1 family protease
LNVIQKDFNRLKPSVWINDQIINAYGYLLNHHDVMIMDTFFFNGWENGFEKTRWRMETNFLDKRVVIFPINLSNTHWVLFWIDANAKQVLYYAAKGSRDKTFLEVIPIN